MRGRIGGIVSCLLTRGVFWRSASETFVVAPPVPRLVLGLAIKLGLKSHVGDLHWAGRNPGCFFVMSVGWDRTASYSTMPLRAPSARGVCAERWV